MTLDSPGVALREKVARGAFWSLLIQATERVFGLARTVIVARILAPEDIGLFALAIVTLLIVDTLSKTGIQSALIYKPGDIENDLSIAWTVHLFRGAIRGGALFVIAPAVAAFFKTPAAAPLIRVVALAMVVEGFTNSGVIYLKKDLALHKQFVLDVSRFATDLCVAVAAAYYWRSAAALTYGLVAGYAAQVWVSYRIHPFRPRFTFDRRAFGKLMRYGIWMNLYGGGVLIGTHGASLVIGKLIDVRALGLYQMAHWITQSALVEVAGAFSVVAFSAYSKMQDDAARLRTAFIKMAGFSLGAALPVAMGIVMVGDVFVQVALGAKWSGVGPALQLLALAALLNAIALSGRPVFLGLGQPRSLFLMQSLGAVVLLLSIYPFAAAWGVAGAARAMAVSGLAMLIYWAFRIRRVLALTVADFRQLFGPAVLGTATMCAVVALALRFARPDGAAGGIAWLIGVSAAAALVYTGTLRLIEPLFPTNRPLDAFAAFFGKSRELTSRSGS